MPVQHFNRTGQGQGDLRLQQSQGFLLDKALDWNSQDLSSALTKLLDDLEQVTSPLHSTRIKL